MATMRNVRVILGPIVLFIALASAQSGTRKASNTPQPLPTVPKTVDEAVSALKGKWLSPTDLQWLLGNPKEQAVAILYWLPFGAGVRNQFGLWGGNQELRDSCGVNDPEGCSIVIFNRLWESVRTESDPELVRQLDCQFRLAEAIHINYKGFYRLTTGELVKAMQSQIDEQIPKLAAAGTSVCQGSLMVDVTGEPDMHCFVDASFARKRKSQPKDQPTEASLQMLLGWLGIRNFFRASHTPSRIVLSFTRKCQFPTPPYLYGTPNGLPSRGWQPDFPGAHTIPPAPSHRYSE
jgi:hypothetical protein